MDGETLRKLALQRDEFRLALGQAMGKGASPISHRDRGQWP
jgi:hypothetical protein